MLFSYPALEAIIASIARALPAHATLLDIGFPGSSISALMGKVAPSLKRVQAITPDLLAQHSDFTAGLVSVPDVIALAEPAQNIQYGTSRRLGPVDISVPQDIIAFRTLHDLAAEFAALAFLRIDLTPGHTPLLLRALAPLAQAGTIIWADIADTQNTCTQSLLDQLPQDIFEVFVVTRTRLVTLPQDHVAGDATALIVLPRSTWQGFGLHMLATDPLCGEGAAVPTRLIAPTGLGASQSVMDRLGRDTQNPLLTYPKKLFLPVGSQSFVSDTTLSPDSQMTAVLKPKAQLRFAVPTAGTFNLSIVTSQKLDARACAALRICVDGQQAPFKWIGEWYQIEIESSVTVTDPRRPITLTLERTDSMRYDGYPVSITGVQLRLTTDKNIDLLAGKHLHGFDERRAQDE